MVFSRSVDLKHPGQQLPQQGQEVMVVVGPAHPPPLQPWSHQLPNLHNCRRWNGTVRLCNTKGTKKSYEVLKGCKLLVTWKENSESMNLVFSAGVTALNFVKWAQKVRIKLFFFLILKGLAIAQLWTCLLQSNLKVRLCNFLEVNYEVILWPVAYGG